MASLTGFTLPEIKDSDLNDEKQRRQILEYLYQLTEQLRFTLSNLDEENFSDSVSDNIQGAYTAASSASKEVKDMSGNVSRIKQFADTLTLAVENGDTSSSIALMANGVQIASEEIILRGAVTFTDLETEGRTTINGSNITTGTIDADLIDVDNLYVKHLNGADGTFSGTLSAPVGEIGGFTISANSLVGSEIGLYPSTSGGRLVLGDVTLTGFGGLTVSGDGMMVHNELIVNGSAYTDYLYLSEDRTAGGSAPDAKLVDKGNGYYSLGYYESRRDAKKDIENIGAECAWIIDNLRPVYFRFKNEPEETRRSVGFIAEEADTVCPEIVCYNTEDKPISIQYSNITALLVAEVQRLRKRMAKLEA